MPRFKRVISVLFLSFLCLNLHQPSYAQAEAIILPSTLNPLGFEVEAGLKYAEGTFICSGTTASVVGADGITLKPVSEYLTVLVKQSKGFNKKLKSKKIANSKKKGLEKKLKALSVKIKKTQKNQKSCAKGKGQGNKSALAAGSLNIATTNPAPDAQGNISYTALTTNSNGMHFLGFVGSGFTSSQRVRVILGSRILWVKSWVDDPNNFRIKIPHPITATLQVSVHQTTPQGVVVSNTLVANLLSGNMVGGVGDEVATLIQELPSVSAGLPQPSDYVLNVVLPIPDKLIHRSQVEGGTSHFTVVPLTGGTAVPMDGVPVELSTDGAHLTKIELVARVPRVQTGNNPVPVSQFKVVYQPNAGAPVTPQSPGSDVRALLNSAPFAVHPSVLALFPNGINAIATDMYNNQYSCRLDQQQFGQIQIFKWTRHLVAFAVHCVTAPVAPNATTLPRLVNTKVYFEITRDAAMKMTVTIGNTLSGKALNNNNPLATGFQDLPIKSFAIRVSGSFGAMYSWAVPVAQPTVETNGFTTFNIVPVRQDGATNIIEGHKLKVAQLAIFQNTPTAQAAAEMAIENRGLAFTVGGPTSSGLLKYAYHKNPFTGMPGPTKGLAGSDFAHFGISALKSHLDSKYSSFASDVANGTCSNMIQSDQIVDDNGTPGLKCDDQRQRVYKCNIPYLGSDQIQNNVAPLQFQGTCPSSCAPGTTCNGTGTWVVAAGAPSPVKIPTGDPWIKEHGVEYAGMTGGTYIVPAEGVLISAGFSNRAAKALFMTAISNAIRAEYLQQLNGRFTSPLDVITPSGYLPLDIDPSGQWSNNKFALSEFASAPSNAHLVAAQNANLIPFDKMNYSPNDWQHWVRQWKDIIGSVHLTNHPLMNDLLRAHGYLAYFARPNLPQNGSTFQGQSLPGLASSTAGAGTSFGRAEAWIYSAAATAYSLYGDDSYRTLMLPYFEFLTNNVLAHSQMWHGLLLKAFNINKLYTSTDPACKCQATGSPTREAGYSAIALHALLKSVFEGTGSTHEGQLRNVLINLSSAKLVKPFLSPNNGWFAMYVNGGAISPISAPNNLYTDWNQVDPICKNALTNSAQCGASPDAGESRYMVAVGDLELPNPEQWTELRANLNNSKPDPASGPESVIAKIKRFGIYEMDYNRNELAITLGYCEYLESIGQGHTCG